jgi:HlyD family secretion protein/epimerase transport system membrane fusion protein
MKVFYDIKKTLEAIFAWFKEWILQDKESDPNAFSTAHHAQTPAIPKHPITQSIVRTGLVILTVFLGGFLIWATFFPLESGTVANGNIVIETNRKTIQHLEGGIVSEIFVHEGEEVRKGQKLIQLDQAQTIANLRLLKSQTHLLLAREASLKASRDHADHVTYPKRLLELANKNDPEVQDIIADETRIFTSRKNTLEDGVATLKNKLEQLKNEIQSLKAQVKSSEDQLALIKEELQSWESLNKNYVDKPKVLALKREATKLEGDRNEQMALIARAEQRMTEAELNVTNFIDTKENEVLKQLEDTEYNLVSNLQKEIAAEDVVNRSLITAPQEGIVLNLKVHTIGGVIAPREPLMDIVPEQEKLIIEAKINPINIAVVRPGLLAKVKLTAYKQRTTPSLDGVVDSVSADTFKDERSTETYFVARISVDIKELARLPEVTLQPGMPVQVLIIVDKRTPMEYFLKPIIDSFHRAFREQ